MSTYPSDRSVVLITGSSSGFGRLTAESENGMRGYVLTGDRRFLDTFDVAMPRFGAELESLRNDAAARDEADLRLGKIAYQMNDMTEAGRRFGSLIGSTEVMGEPALRRRRIRAISCTRRLAIFSATPGAALRSTERLVSDSR